MQHHSGTHLSLTGIKKPQDTNAPGSFAFAIRQKRSFSENCISR